MASYYSVLQFVPDPLTDERVNVGVVAVDDEGVHTHLLSDWRRVQSFGCENVTTLRRALQSLGSELLVKGPEAAPGRLRDLTASWHRSIQATEPRASLLAADRLINEMAALMLKQTAIKRRPRTKTVLVANARASLEKALAKKAGASEMVKSHDPVQGRYVEHEVDLAVRNGKLLLTAQAISFVRTSPAGVRKDIAACTWVLEDIRESSDPPPIAVLVGVPDNAGASDDYTMATKLFRDLNAEVVPAEGVEKWAAKLARASCKRSDQDVDRLPVDKRLTSA